MNTQERRDLAIRASQSISGAFGFPAGIPKVLKDTNHTIVHLWPSPIVAKVSTQKVFRHRSSSLDREVAVAALLASSGAPVARPATCLPAGPHKTGGVELTFWDYCEVDPARLVPPEEVAATLRLVHDTFDRLGDRLPPLPSFKLQLSEAEELLNDSAVVPQLSENDRLFLRSVLRETMEAIGSLELETRALHGECNPGQMVATRSSLVWLDFEAACLGPKEWDLAAMDEKTIEAYGTANQSLLSLLRTARLLCVTAWCWTQPDRDPEVREAAEYHLMNLKRRSGVRRD